MSILVTPIDSTTAEIRESRTVERDFYGFGSERTRDIYRAALTWICDEDGAQGDTIPATYTNAAGTSLDLVGVEEPVLVGVNMGGRVTAIYEGKGAWSY